MATRLARPYRKRGRMAYECPVAFRLWSGQAPRPSVRILIGRFAGRGKKIGLDGAGHLDHERLTSAIERLACGGPNPLFADTIFLDVAPLDAAKAPPNAARQRRLIIERARRVDAEPVGRNVGHLRSSAPVSTRGRAISRRAP